MSDQKEYSAEETKRKEKLKADEAMQLAKDEVRKKAYLAKEKEIERAQNARDSNQTEKRTAENIKDAAREKARKEIYLAHEKKIAEEQEARRHK